MEILTVLVGHPVASLFSYEEHVEEVGDAFLSLVVILRSRAIKKNGYSDAKHLSV